MAINIRHVDRAKNTVSAHVADPNGLHHRVGHLPGEGWFCVQHGTNCHAIGLIRPLVPDIGEPAPTPA